MTQVEIDFLVAVAKIAAIVYMVLQLFVMLIVTRQIMLATQRINTMYGYLVLFLSFAQSLILLGILIYVILLNPQL